MRKYKKVTQDDLEEGSFCVLCEMPFAESYGRPLACEGCGGDGVLDKSAVADKKYWEGVDRGRQAAKDHA